MAAHLNENILFSHTCEETAHVHSLYPITKAREEGHLKVSKLHTLFYATYGNPEGIPVVILHGGPGIGCSDSMTQFFDLERWNVIMFDQRGAMRSTPFCSMEENTPQHSIQDIETLRNHLGIKKWMVFGGSWGSTLAILYGQAHPEACIGFIIRGITFCREQDYLHLFYAMGKIFPEAYHEFLASIPENEHQDLLSACYRRVFDPDPKIHMPVTKAFMRYDLICSTHLPNHATLDKLLQDDRFLLSGMKAFMYYAKHRFFLQPNQILTNMQKITHLPALMVHGRWDAVCLPEMAYTLYQNWQNSKLWMVTEGGHCAPDPAIARALATATDLFADKIRCCK